MSLEASRAAHFKWVLNEDLRILVVDDDPIMREFATVYLSTPTVSVETAQNGEEGLARLHAEPFDIVLLDIDMPGIDGYEVLSRIRRDEKFEHLPVVMVTSNEDFGSIDRAYLLGATSFVTKPLNWRLLSYHLRFIMRSHKAMARC
jgi:CheY-like chemotaxis protein